MGSVQSRASEEAALATPELLESILLHVDMRTLLVSAQRVCRGWKDLISTSPQLQQVLFLQGDSSRNPASAIANPLLAELFPPWFGTVSDIADLAIEELPVGKRTGAFYRPDASWRRMHICQPPARRLGDWRVGGGTVRFDGFKKTHYASGVRMGQFYALALKCSYDWICYVTWVLPLHKSLHKPTNGGLGLFVWDPKFDEEEVVEFCKSADVLLINISRGSLGGLEDGRDDSRKPDGHGYVPIGGRWFEDGGCFEGETETVWEKDYSRAWD